MGILKNWKNYKDGEVTYNPEVPIHSAQYQLKNSDHNVEQLRKRYNIPTRKVPKLLLKGSGNLKGSSVGYKNIEFTFVGNKEENIYFTDIINFNPMYLSIIRIIKNNVRTFNNKVKLVIYIKLIK